MANNNHILKNLHSLIRNSALTYMNEFVWQDIELTEEFKMAYKNYLEENRYDIEFLGATAVITSPSAKYIFVPNQWFVIAAYAVDVYEELCRYKEYFRKISEVLYKRPDIYAKQLRDNATIVDNNEIVQCAKMIFSSFCSDQGIVEESSFRLWRFVNDYSWWSGHKTIDRGDFHVSVILNMLNLVNVSQGYVADIVSAYANNLELRKLVGNINGFTINTGDGEIGTKDEYNVADEEIRNQNKLKDPRNEYEKIPKPDRVKIKINGTSTLKEIKYKL